MKVHSGPTPSVKSISEVVSACRKVVDSFDCWEIQGDGLANGFMPFLLASGELHHSISQLPVYDDGRLGSVVGWPFEFPGAVRGIVLNFRSMVSNLGIDSYFKDDGSSNGMIATQGVYRVDPSGKQSTDGMIIAPKSLKPELVATEVRKVEKACQLLAKWVAMARVESFQRSERVADESRASPDEQPAGYLGIVVDEAERTVGREGFEAITSFAGKRVLWPTFITLFQKRGKVVADDTLKRDVHDAMVEGGTLSKNISRVNSQIASLGLLVERVERSGYKLVER